MRNMFRLGTVFCCYLFLLFANREAESLQFVKCLVKGDALKSGKGGGNQWWTIDETSKPSLAKWEEDCATQEKYMAALSGYAIETGPPPFLSDASLIEALWTIHDNDIWPQPESHPMNDPKNIIHVSTEEDDEVTEGDDEGDDERDDERLNLEIEYLQMLKQNYVSFQTFDTEFRAALYEMLGATEKSDAKIFVVVPLKSSKSGYWLLSRAWASLASKICGLSLDPEAEDVSKRPIQSGADFRTRCVETGAFAQRFGGFLRVSDDHRRRSTVLSPDALSSIRAKGAYMLLLDDMAYSGAQLAHYMYNIAREYRATGKAMGNPLDSTKSSTSGTQKNIDFLVAVPYMTAAAIKVAHAPKPHKTTLYTKAESNAAPMQLKPGLYTKLKKKYKLKAKDVMGTPYVVDSGRSSSYFDFKLADSWSIVRPIINPYLRKSSETTLFKGFDDLLPVAEKRMLMTKLPWEPYKAKLENYFGLESTDDDLSRYGFVLREVPEVDREALLKAIGRRVLQDDGNPRYTATGTWARGGRARGRRAARRARLHPRLGEIPQTRLRTSPSLPHVAED